MNDELRIVDLIGLSKDELFRKLGEDYIITEGSADQIDSVGYFYPRYNIKFTFDWDDIAEVIYCYGGSDINGACLGMNISEIESILGKGKTLISNNGPPYSLRYRYDDYFIWFSFYDEDGCAGGITIGLWSVSYTDNINENPIGMPEFFNDIGKSFRVLKNEHPNAQIRILLNGYPNAAAAGFGDPYGAYSYFFFGGQDGDFDKAMNELNEQLKCAGFVTTAGVLFPGMEEDMSFSDFFSLIDVSDYEYFGDDPDTITVQGWLYFTYDNMDVWLNANEASGNGGWDFTDTETIKRNAPVSIVNTEISGQNQALADAVMFN